ncbi:MAG: preprotein translocase subunit YajC [Pseudomonadales bacterium]|nr:preprotein translocase subunit YajC [Pseudomonadales bacterium]
MLDLLIPAAQAQTGVPQSGGEMIQLGMIVVLFVVFYFLIIRPQRKRQKDQDNMISALQVGDEVSTNAGILGKVRKQDENYVVLKVADNVELKFQKASILAVLPKGTIKAI